MPPASCPISSRSASRHVYTSPFFTARPGSTHGYDVVDHRALNPEFGGEAGFARLSAALKDAGLGLILDFVPNHMAVGSGNAWWMDVLEWGSEIAARGGVRHQLGAAAVPTRRRRAAAGAGQALRRGADRRRDCTPVRRRHRQLLGLVFRPALSDQSAPLCRHHQDRGGGGACDRRAGRTRAARACRRQCAAGPAVLCGRRRS